jgi:hypothetical protein
MLMLFLELGYWDPMMPSGIVVQEAQSCLHTYRTIQA